MEHCGTLWNIAEWCGEDLGKIWGSQMKLEWYSVIQMKRMNDTNDIRDILRYTKYTKMTKWQWQNDLDKLYITGLWRCKTCNEKSYIEIVSGKPFVIVILTPLTSGMLREGLRRFAKGCEGLGRFEEDFQKSNETRIDFMRGRMMFFDANESVWMVRMI